MHQMQSFEMVLQWIFTIHKQNLQNLENDSANKVDLTIDCIPYRQLHILCAHYGLDEDDEKKSERKIITSTQTVHKSLD